jgi:uncharacterized protein
MAVLKVRSILIWMTETCNLRCTYCYEKHKPKHFNAEAVKDKIMRLFEQGVMDLTADELTFSFYGGEPLLEFEALQGFVEWLEENIPIKFRLSITTNGALITPEIAQWLADKHFGMLFSIDGDRESMIARSNSYDAVVAGWQHLKAAGMSPEANMTFRPDQLSRWHQNIGHVIELGFRAFNLNPLDGAAYDFGTTLDTFRAVYATYLTEWLPMGIKTSSLSKPFKAIREGKAENGCGAGKGFLAIAPDGEVYPCHKLVQTPATCMSAPQGISGHAKSYWEHFDSKQSECCMKCLVRHLCHGPCAAVNAVTTGDLHVPSSGDCAFRKAHLLAAQEAYCRCSEEQIQEVIGLDRQAVCTRD